MKLSLGKRIVLFFHWLFSLSLLLAVAFMGYTYQYWNQLHDLWGIYATIAVIAYIVINVVLSAAVLLMIVKREKRTAHGFIEVDSSETGKVRIAISAIEQMVKQAVCNVDGISDLKIKIEEVDEAIEVNVAITMFNGAHVPTVTMSMQRAIRQYVEMNCGISVRSVSVSIQAVTPADNAGKKSRRQREKQAKEARQALAPAAESEAVYTENIPEKVSHEISDPIQQPSEEEQPAVEVTESTDYFAEPEAAEAAESGETEESYDGSYDDYTEPVYEEVPAAEPAQEDEYTDAEPVGETTFESIDDAPENEEEKKI